MSRPSNAGWLSSTSRLKYVVLDLPVGASASLENRRVVKDLLELTTILVKSFQDFPDFLRNPIRIVLRIVDTIPFFLFAFEIFCTLAGPSWTGEGLSFLVCWRALASRPSWIDSPTYVDK